MKLVVIQLTNLPSNMIDLDAISRLKYRFSTTFKWHITEDNEEIGEWYKYRYNKIR